jgi:hypothetical protein
VWILKFTDGADSTIYRFLCLSRNLTFSNSWDTVLSLEGPTGPRPVKRNEPLALFLDALPGFALRGLPQRVSTELASMASEIRRVSFQLPESVDEVRLWPIGIGARPPDPFHELNRAGFSGDSVI